MSQLSESLYFVNLDVRTCNAGPKYFFTQVCLNCVSGLKHYTYCIAFIYDYMLSHSKA